jgi:putative (di)nucleoside polyphosphate hydrolase
LIDPEGFRPNVGIILSNSDRRLFWGRRVGQNAWQFPQGGINAKETPLDAMFRELEEEVGLLPDQVTVLGSTRGWLRYRLPKRFIRHQCGPTCIGQKQRWFLLRVNCSEEAFCLDRCEKPEFDAWRWVRYWQPLREVVYFKRRVYERALDELAPLLYPEGVPTRHMPVPNQVQRKRQTQARDSQQKRR